MDRPVSFLLTGSRARATIKADLDRLMADFFRAVSFEEGGAPEFESIQGLFEAGLHVKNVSSTPEIGSVGKFIVPTPASVRSGEVRRFSAIELAEFTDIFGNVAHRFNSYAKSGTMNGVAFFVRGMISTQFILTFSGWKISAMAWDDERPGLAIPAAYEPETVDCEPY
jgi:hypothetical protein